MAGDCIGQLCERLSLAAWNCIDPLCDGVGLAWDCIGNFCDGIGLANGSSQFV